MRKIYLIFILVLILLTFVLILSAKDAKSQELAPDYNAYVVEFQPGSIRAVITCDPISGCPYGINSNMRGEACWKEVGDPGNPICDTLFPIFLDGYWVLDGFWWPPACTSWNFCRCDKYHSNYVLLSVVVHPDPQCLFCDHKTAYGTPFYWSRGYCLYCPIGFRNRR